jgi:hypothetical protein
LSDPKSSEILLQTSLLRNPYSRAAILYVAIVLAVASPICFIEYFAVRDGSAHVYNASLIHEILSGGSDSTSGLRLNTLAVPNSTGHWMLVGLLQFFGAITSVKILMIAEYAGFLAVLALLRILTSGSDGLCTVLLLAAAYSLNIFWFDGFFNFVNGLIGYVLSVAIFYQWRDRLRFLPICALTIVLLLTYLSHIVCFAAAMAALLILSIFSTSDRRISRASCVVISGIPSIVLAVIYKLSTVSAEPLFPVWKWVVVSDSFFSFLRNFLVDPFIIISRRTIPFTEINSSLCVLLSPDLWIFTCITILIVASVVHRGSSQFDFLNAGPFLVIFGALAVGGLLAPDNFGESNGSILRERLILCGLCMTVVLFHLHGHKLFQRFIQGVLTYVLVFQIVAMWEYGLLADKTVREFTQARSVMVQGDQIMAIVTMEDGYRFHSLVDAQLDLLISVGQPSFVWDNYELGYTLFPLITNSLDEREFIRDLAISHVFVKNGPAQEREKTESRLEELLATGNHRFTKIIIWGHNVKVETILNKWFDPLPIFKSDRITVLRHR